MVSFGSSRINFLSLISVGSFGFDGGGAFLKEGRKSQEVELIVSHLYFKVEGLFLEVLVANVIGDVGDD